jgi:hypothetical protein
LERIKATDEQKEKISSLIDARMEEAKPLREDLRAGALEFSQLNIISGKISLRALFRGEAS